MPPAEASPVFVHYRDRTWLWVTSGTAAVTLGGLTLATGAGLLLGGLGGLLAGVGLGITGGIWAGLKMSASANGHLRRKLRKTLGVRGRGIFVGLRANQDDLWSELNRKETDDNVGFLEFEEHGLVLTSEAGKVRLRRDAIRGFERETVKAVPLLWFIRVLVDHEGDEGAFLLVSREGDSLRDQEQATQVLYKRLIEWHADYQLAWLAAHRPGTDEAEGPDPYRRLPASVASRPQDEPDSEPEQPDEEP